MHIYNEHYLHIGYFVLFNVKKYYVRIPSGTIFIIQITA